MTMDPMPPEPPESFTPGYQTGGGVTSERAGFGTRLGSFLIDWIMLVVLSIILRVTLGGLGVGLFLLIDVLYYTLLIGGSRGQTIGQRAVGVRVIDVNGGGTIGYGRAFVRWLVSIVSFWVIFLGYLWMLWDEEKQCWHDKAASDYVVPAKTSLFDED